MKKTIIGLILIGCLLVALSPYSSSFGWMKNYQQAIDHINASYMLEQGKITSYQYLMSGSDELHDYIKFLVDFENGERRLLNVNVTWRQHGTNIGPDFRYESISLSHKMFLDGTYTCLADQIEITIDRNWHFTMRSLTDETSAVSGSGYFEDDHVLILNDFEHQWRFIADDDVMVLLSEGDEGLPFTITKEPVVFTNFHD